MAGMDLPKDVETWSDVVDRCAKKERQDRPAVRIADLLVVPLPAELRAAGCHPVAVPLVGALLARMAEQTRGMFLSMSVNRVDAAPDWLTAAALGPTLADVVRSALASALFGWLP